MQHILYKTICKPTDEFYVGIHSTDNVNDGYLGSGVMLRERIKEYGREAFRQEILFLCDDRATLELLEDVIVKPLLVNPICLNMVGGGSKGWYKNTSKKKAELIKAKISKSNKGKKTHLSTLTFEERSELAGRNRPKINATIKKKTDEKYQKLISVADFSDVDFTRYGWVGEVAKRINIKPQKVNKIMKTYLPNIYETAYKRSSNRL